MKIAILVNSLENKGPVIVAVNLARKLYDAGESVTLFYFVNKVEKINTFDIPLKKISCSDFFMLSDFDVVHSHSLLPDMFNAVQSMLNNNFSITTVHNNIYTDLYPEYGKWKSLMLKFLWKVSWHFIEKKICISNALLLQYLSRMKNKVNGWECIYNSVPQTVIEVLNNSDEAAINEIIALKENGYLIIGACAVITQRKGLQHLISAAKHLPDKYVVVIVGDGPYKEELINMSTKGNVIFFDRTMAPRSFMRCFDIYAMPSISEGFGLAAVEAAFEGCQIVCSNIPTFVELFDKHCAYFSLDNPIEFIDAIGYAQSLPKRGIISLINKKFSETHMLNKYLEVYYRGAH